MPYDLFPVLKESRSQKDIWWDKTCMGKITGIPMWSVQVNCWLSLSIYLCLACILWCLESLTHSHTIGVTNNGFILSACAFFAMFTEIQSQPTILTLNQPQKSVKIHENIFWHLFFNVESMLKQHFFFNGYILEVKQALINKYVKLNLKRWLCSPGLSVALTTEFNIEYRLSH